MNVGARGRRGRRVERAATRWAGRLATGLVVLLAGCAGDSGTTAAPEDPAPQTAGENSQSAPVAGSQDGGPGGIGGLASLVAQASGSPGVASSIAGAAPSGTTSPKSPSAAAAGVRTVGPGDLLMFATPSKNIGCAFSPDEVRCDIDKHTWLAPERPASCELDYGSGLFLADGPAGFTCAGDTVLAAPGAPVVGYDQKVTGGDLECVVNKAGITCRNLATRHGFTLSREAHTEF